MDELVAKRGLLGASREEMPAELSRLEFHHIGVACADIDKESRNLALLGYVAEGGDFTDPVQGIRGRFLSGQHPRLELVAPLGESGVLTPWLNSKTKLYHLAFMVDYLDVAISSIRAQRGKLIVPPVPAVGFAGREIAFLMLPNLLLVELIRSRASHGE